jgi:hypothetical protein
MELRLLIRQNPIVNVLNQQIYYDGLSPTSLQGVVGTLPVQRQWPTYNNFIDATEDCSDLFKMQLQWSEQKDNEGSSIPGSNQVKKGVAGTITIEGESYRLIKKWLIDDISAPFNQVEVKIQDVGCGYYEGYLIKSKDLSFCESGFCSFDLNIKQKDNALDCIKKTLINDNWQGWFQKAPLNGKKHPRFSYCVEQRPNGMMIALWYVMGQVMGPVVLILFGISLALNALIFAINGLIAALNSLGFNIGFLQPLNPLAVFDSFNMFFIETAGCGREHPAPLIRDYITNVCDKCGIGYDPVTAPIFFAQNINIETSDPNRGSGGIINVPNPHYNACYLLPSLKKGIRRVKSINLLTTSLFNTTEFWIPENEPNLALDQFLDQLKPLYNAEWRIKNGMLYFWRKDWFKDGSYLYDFSTNGADRAKILEGICFETNDIKQAATCYGLYQSDSVDDNEAGGGMGNGQTNGIVSFVNNSPNTLASSLIDNNPSFDGILDKTTRFGATKFNLDGASTCYYYDAMQQLANSGLLNLTVLIQVALIKNSFAQYADYALLMQSDLSALPKVLIWDGQDYLNAKAVKPKAAWDGIAPQPMPDINPIYNITPELWKQRHAPETFVLGSGLTLGPSPNGRYFVGNFFNAPIADSPALLVNYPMYFEPYYYDTMWDWFHWIDDPRKNPTLNQSWRVKLPYCCEDAQKLGILNNAEGIELGRRVKGTNGYYPDMKIEDILVSFDNEDTYGKYIQLSGTL